MWKEYHLAMEGIRKRALFCQKWYVKWLGVGPRGGTSSYETLLSTPLPPPPGCIWKLPRLPLWLASEFITLLQLNEIFLHWCYFPPRKLNLSGKACLRNGMHGKRWKSLFVVHWKELFPMSSGRTLTKASKMRTWNFLPI